MERILREFSEDGECLDETPTAVGQLPIIAIIGRPNTGKSTIVNKLTDSYKVRFSVRYWSQSYPHRMERSYTMRRGSLEIGLTGLLCGTDTTSKWWIRGASCLMTPWTSLRVLHTGLIVDSLAHHALEKINDQSLYALNEAQAAIMVCDGLEGVNPLDEALAQFLRKHNRTPLYLAVNKCESETRGVLQAQDFWSLGLGQPYPVSGIHGTGLGRTEEHLRMMRFD